MIQYRTAFTVGAAYSVINMSDPSSPLIKGTRMEKIRKGLPCVNICSAIQIRLHTDQTKAGQEAGCNAS
jgi:hypothetical protein